jgi:hypothetical protein
MASPQPPPAADPYASTALADKLQKIQAEYGPPPTPTNAQPAGHVPGPPRPRTGTAEMPALSAHLPPVASQVASSPAPSQVVSSASAQPLSPLASSNIVQRGPYSPPPSPASPPQAPPTPLAAQAPAMRHPVSKPTPNPAMNMFGSQVQRPAPHVAALQTPQTPQSAIAPGAGSGPQAAQSSQPQMPYGPPRPASFGAGALVYVQWSDGNRYPATVQQVSGGQCLVLFNDGRQQWVEARYLTSV